MKNIVKTINKKNLKENIKHIKSLQKNVCAVVKADAYSHGIKNIVPEIDKEVSFYAVNTIKEAKIVRKLSQKPILVLCGFEKRDLNFATNNNIHLAVFCKKQLEYIKKYVRKHTKTALIHLKINTGMNRLGFCFDELEDVKNIIKAEPRIKLFGVFTHFGGGSKKRNKEQNETFLECQKMFSKTLVHSKSSSFLEEKSLENEMVRCGLMLYGYGNKNVKPVLEVKAKIIFIGSIKKGDYVGYGTNFIAKQKMRYAVLAIGYSDGLFRNYAKSGYVLIHDKKAKICGNICMNMTIVNIDKIDANIGDYALILGEKLDANIIAKNSGTICYEVLTNLGKK